MRPANKSSRRPISLRRHAARIHNHDIGRILGAFHYSRNLTVLGDAYPYTTPAGMTATVLFAGTTPGDTATT